MKYLIPLIVLAAIMIGCSANNPVAPATDGLSPTAIRNPYSATDDCHKLWGEFNFFIGAQHDKVDVVPKREGRFHLNALKFLEEGGKNFLQITGIKNNGDGTIDLGIKITHPFAGHPEFTGFDVKGIIMFNGSHQIPWDSLKIFPFYQDVLVSWKETGDPELLNPDGYSPRWSPSWDSGSALPILNYWPGKFSNGTPTANLNAFINFYTDEPRHMFKAGNSVEESYHIWLPPGPLTAGYAVEACWEPPIKTPVTDPASDFPESANQPESYHFRYVVNGDQPIIHAPCCGSFDDCETLWVENLYWYGEKPNYGFAQVPGLSYNFHSWMCIEDCSLDQPPYNSDWQNPRVPNIKLSDLPDGTYRGVACLYEFIQSSKGIAAYDVFTFTVDLE
ncbi:MAG: hypothetical protein ABIC40_03835 [bacterium]